MASYVSIIDTPTEEGDHFVTRVHYLDGSTDIFSSEDADITLYDESGTVLVAYPDGVEMRVPGTAIKKVEILPIEE